MRLDVKRIQQQVEICNQDNVIPSDVFPHWAVSVSVLIVITSKPD